MTEQEMRHILKGSFTLRGVDNWFDRPRAWLGGKTPRQVIQSGDAQLMVKLEDHLKALQGPGLAT